jgi:ABC-type transport system involved in multi-copper enzyme maturation permease subunit
VIPSFRGESLKTRKRWANWILLGILLAWIIVLVYLVPYIFLSHPPKNFNSPVPASELKRSVFPENLIPSALSTTASIGAAIMIILGALSTASEYGWLTVQTILIQKPGRTAVLLGKFLTLGVAALLIGVTVLATGAIASSLFVTIDHASSTWPSGLLLLKGIGAILLELGVWTGFGAFLGIAFRSTAAAIGGGLTYLFVGEGLLGGLLLRNVPIVKDLLNFLPGVAAEAVNTAFPTTYRSAGATPPVIDAGRGTITLLIYLVLFVVMSVVIFRDRDVGGS